MLNVEMDDGWNSDEEEEPKVPLSKKERQKLYHLKVGEKERGEA